MIKLVYYAQRKTEKRYLKEMFLTLPLNTFEPEKYF